MSFTSDIKLRCQSKSRLTTRKKKGESYDILKNKENTEIKIKSIN